MRHDPYVRPAYKHDYEKLRNAAHDKHAGLPDPSEADTRTERQKAAADNDLARARLIEKTLYAFGHSAGDLDIDAEAIIGLSQVAEELADELEALRLAEVKRPNADREKLKAAGLES
jgi:hypothetical protein